MNAEVVVLLLGPVEDDERELSLSDCCCFEAESWVALKSLPTMDNLLSAFTSDMARLLIELDRGLLVELMLCLLLCGRYVDPLRVCCCCSDDGNAIVPEIELRMLSDIWGSGGGGAPRDT